jgi:hypothetical protein
MTPVREAIVLPLLFLTVTLLGGFRVATTVKLVPPSLTALMLAMLLIATLVRGRVLHPAALMHGSRTPAENSSGLVILLVLFAASAQAISLLLPDRGLLHAGFGIFVFCQLMTMNAAGPDRVATLRGLFVLFGSLFVLRHIAIEALYAPERGVLHRVLTALMSGASLGGINYEPNAAVTGYAAFFTLLLYVVGLWLLPAGGGTALVHVRPPDEHLRPV